jgi:hypothetical protein
MTHQLGFEERAIQHARREIAAWVVESQVRLRCQLWRLVYLLPIVDLRRMQWACCTEPVLWFEVSTVYVY